MKLRQNEEDARGPDSLPAGGNRSCTEGEGRVAVCLELLRQGRDWLLLIGGGQVHVGAVAVAWPDAAGRIQDQVVVIPPHKEGPLAVNGARAVAWRSGRTCTAVAGIHQDQATRQEIEEIVANVDRALARLLDQAFPPAGGPGENHGQP